MTQPNTKHMCPGQQFLFMRWWGFINWFVSISQSWRNFQKDSRDVLEVICGVILGRIPRRVSTEILRGTPGRNSWRSFQPEGCLEKLRQRFLEKFLEELLVRCWSSRNPTRRVRVELFVLCVVVLRMWTEYPVFATTPANCRDPFSSSWFRSPVYTRIGYN